MVQASSSPLSTSTPATSGTSSDSYHLDDDSLMVDVARRSPVQTASASDIAQLKQLRQRTTPRASYFTSSPLSQRPLSPTANSESGSESSTSAINIPNARRPIQLASIESISMLAAGGNAFIREHDVLPGPSRSPSIGWHNHRCGRRYASSSMLHPDTALSSSSEDEDDVAEETVDSFDASVNGSFMTSYMSRSSGRSRPTTSPNSYAGSSPMVATSPPFLRESVGRRRSSGSWAANRRVSASILTTTPPASPSIFSASFVGSFEASLLSGRMANRPSNSAALPFSAQLGVLGLGKDTPRGLKCPDHINMQFGAYFWDMDSRDRQGKGSPYVGNLNLEDYYFEQLEKRDATTVPKFPGYRIPPKGQIQLVIKNANETAVKLFLVPYDLTDMPAGSKTFLRQKSYDIPSDKGRLIASTSSHQKETLRYAIHLQVCSPPVKAKERGRRRVPPAHKCGAIHSQPHSVSPVKGTRHPDPIKTDLHPSPARRKPDAAAYLYLHQTIRTVFTSRALDMSEKLRSVLENPNGTCDKDGMLLSSEANQSQPDRALLYMPYKGPGEEWDSARKARILQVKAIELRTRLEDPVPSDPNAASFSSGMTFLDVLKQDNRALLNTPPSLRSEGGLGIALDEPPASVEKNLSPTLTFGRKDASRFEPLPALMESGLSISRPGSRNGSSSAATTMSKPVSPEHRTFGILPDGCLR